MKIVAWIVKYRSSAHYRGDRPCAWRNSRRMSWSEARKIAAVLQGAGYETRITEISVAQWIRMPLRKKLGSNV